MRIGILLCGHSHADIVQIYGTYDTLFHDLLDGFGFSFETYAVVDGHFPENVTDQEGWLITGSKHGVYEDHSWIPPLEDFIRDSYRASIPLVGICFGHQIIAQALGGRVEKFSGGWSVGEKEYIYQDHCIGLAAFHQDQVVQKPPESQAIGGSDFCEFGFLLYPQKAYTMQPHPEFTKDYLRTLLETNAATLPDMIVETARHQKPTPLDHEIMGQQIATFFKTGTI